MAFMPRDIKGEKPDGLNNLNGFFGAYGMAPLPEKPPSQNITAFSKAATQEQKPKAPDPDATILSPEQQQAAQNPHTINRNGSYFASLKTGGAAYSDDTQEKKEEARLRQLQNYMMQSVNWGGFSFSFKQVTNHLSGSLTQQKAFIETPPKEITQDQLLWKDSNGNRVDVDIAEMQRDPRKYEGVSQVMTTEEKTAMEAKDAQCALGVVGNDIGFVNDKMVHNNDITLRHAIAEKTLETEDALAKLQSGAMKLEDLPEHLQKDVVEMEANGGQLKALSKNEPGIVDDLERDAAQKEMLQEHRFKTPAPSASMTPAPSFQ